MSRREGTELSYTEWSKLEKNIGKSTYDFISKMNAKQQAEAKPDSTNPTTHDEYVSRYKTMFDHSN